MEFCIRKYTSACNIPAALHELHAPQRSSLGNKNYFQQHEAPGEVLLPLSTSPSYFSRLLFMLLITCFFCVLIQLHLAFLLVLLLLPLLHVLSKVLCVPLTFSLTCLLPVYKYILLWNHALSHYFCATLQLHNLPVDCARELFNPLTLSHPG